MTPEEWPIAAPTREAATPARAAGRGRLRTVRVDFFLKPQERLSEQERALMTAMLQCLIEDIAAQLRAASGGREAADDDDARLVESLTVAGLLDEPGLIALLLQRAEEERIGSAARARSGRREARALQGLVSHHEPGVSAAAMGLILARGRRRNRFGQCLVAFDDLPASTAERLANAVAAALAAAKSTDRDSSEAGAATDLVKRHDWQKSIEALTASLVQHLTDAADLSDELLLVCAQEGEVALIATAAAAGAHVGASLAAEELLSGDHRRVARLMKVAGFSRALSAGILASIGDLLGIDDPGAAIAAFDAMDQGQLASARTWLAASSSYRAALQALGGSGG